MQAQKGHGVREVCGRKRGDHRGPSDTWKH